jgi:leucyl-tRNA synthetase
MYLMFLGPFREGGDFRDESITGVRRFLDKVWTLVHEAAETSPLPPAVERKLHQTIHKVTADTESLDYNTAIAAMMEYVNLVREQDAGQRATVEPLVVMLAPYAPHIAEELWAYLGHETSVFQARWPEYDERRAASDEVEIVVQVNGRVRGRLTVARGASEADVLARALADESVRRFVDGNLKKTIYVPDRLLNLVV